MGVNGIYGLSGSGLDIESMVKVGMMGKQKEYDKMAQKYTKNEWTKAAYLELNSEITTFNVSKLSQYKMSSSMNAKSVTSTDSSISVTANASAGVMSHTVKVDQLSSSAYLIGTNSLTRYDLTTGTAYTSSDSESAGVKLADVLFKQNDSSTNTVTRTNGAQVVGYNGSDTAFEFTIGDGEKTETISYTYDDLFNGNVTFTSLTSKISNSGLNIKASYDTVQDKFSFYNSKGGADNGIQLTFGTDNAGRTAQALFENMGLVQSRNGVLENNGNTITLTFGSTNEFMGTDGSVTVDGISGYKMTDNKVTVNGVTYDVSRATEGTTASVAVSQDIDSIVDKVKSFVEDYNKLLSTLYEQYDEKPNSDYKPLTQSQKDSMKDEQIEKWEKKAKAGLLYHDRTIGKIITEMRESVLSKVEGIDSKYNSAYSIGISTTGLKGQLVLDEDKLRAALAEDSDAAYNVFAKLDTDNTTNSKTNGVAQRLGDVFTEATKKIKTRAGSSADITEDSDLNNMLRQLQTRMSNFRKMMSSFEDALYKKYDAMEATLAKLGSQMNFVTGGQ